HSDIRRMPSLPTAKVKTIALVIVKPIARACSRAREARARSSKRGGVRGVEQLREGFEVTRAFEFLRMVTPNIGTLAINNHATSRVATLEVLRRTPPGHGAPAPRKSASSQKELRVRIGQGHHSYSLPKAPRQVRGCGSEAHEKRAFAETSGRR